MEKRTGEEIRAEIAALVAMKPTVRRYSAFDDDNHAAIDAQVRVLSAQMDEDEIYEAFGEDADGFTQHVLDHADFACFWMCGVDDYEAPSADWMPLCSA